MNFRIIVLLLAFVAIVTGCTNKEKKENTVTLENVINSIKAEGPELITQEARDDAILENVKPNLFSIRNAKDDAYSEAIFVYIFDSEKAVKEAKSKARYAITALTRIEFYEKKNALVVYFATWGTIEKFGNKIQSAMQKL